MNQSRTGREGCKHVSKFNANFSPKYFARILRDCHATVVQVSPRNFGELTVRNVRVTRTNVVQMSQDGRMTVIRKHANTLWLSVEKIN